MTNQTMMRSALTNLQSNMSQMAKLQEQASSQKLINRPSDDPTAAASAMAIRSEQRATEQYGRNISDGNAWLTTVDSALSNSSALLIKIRDLTVKGANDGALSAPAKEAIALELESLQSELLSEANTSYLGRSVFAGNSDAGAAFTATFDFTGQPGATVERRVSSGTTVRVDADGAAAFGVGDDSVFALVKNIVSDLRNGTNIGSHLTAIDAHHEAVLGQHATIGARHAEILRAGEVNVEKSVSLESERSNVEDIDLAKIVLDLQVQQVSYQTALAVTARVLQPTLMDFLR
ncbi:flagellar hook-associated protein FlgL [Mycetocola zhadangensis]|uniref:flagellar hook-associated protein FlgL n=1 Tax=Mycetocola zhadangensis TaxID=1164595 RepID=UPI003A4D8234